MAVVPHELDVEVFTKLNRRAEKEEFDKWKGKASDIAGYVASWGVIRFWSLSLSTIGKGGQQSSGQEFDQNYYAWEVARKVLCTIVRQDMGITQGMDIKQFQDRYQELSDVQQVCLSELLIEIADTIQFWTMRIADSLENKKESEEDRND